MTIDLSDYESDAKYDGNYEDALAAVQKRLSHLQSAFIVHGARAIIVFEGWDAAGKGGAIRRLTATLDPRHFEVWPIGAPTAAEAQRHFLYRFWNRLPGEREIAVFDRSWYGRVLVERVEGFATGSEWRRGYREINDFEAQHVEAGTPIIKLFLHITQDEQDRRLTERLDHPWKHWKTGVEDFRNRARRADYLTAMHEMFEKTDTSIAPWRAFAGNNKKAARIAILEHIATQLEGHVKLEPMPLDPTVAKLAKEAFGYKPKR
ncbi:MAG: polyphosphate kinase [Sphingomonadaceae bacterium]|nr:polyphosphate kinase [Sphingomonadaceae bacterium]